MGIASAKSSILHGVGVRAADGIREGAAPEIRPDNAGEVARIAAEHLERGFHRAMAEIAGGDLLPALAQDPGSESAGREHPSPS